MAIANSEESEEPDYRPKFMSSACLASSTFRHAWLIERILVSDQPSVIGGAFKTLKTSIAIDMAISLGSGEPFLGRFNVPEPKRVAVFSSESGMATLKATAERICEAKETRLSDCEVIWAVRLPHLARRRHCESLRQLLESKEIAVVILDPLYLLFGQLGSSAGNLYDMGALLQQAANACLEAGATPVFVHHASKSSTAVKQDESYRPPSLNDLAFAGVGEYFRQWLLLGRRAPYQDGTGLHRLSLVVGGDAGHSRWWNVDIDEGRLDRQFKGRTWAVEVSQVWPEGQNPPTG